jgi:hypothetical protein
VYSPGWQKTASESPTQASPTGAFIGVPKTMADLYKCDVVGNYNSMIYHLKGSTYIPKMTTPKKECFATEADAMRKGFRKAKAY